MTQQQTIALITEAATDETLNDAAFRVVVLSLVYETPPTDEDLAWARRELKELTLLQRIQ